MKDKKKNWKLFCSFLLAFLPRLFLNLQINPFIVPNDEASTLSGAAFFAGLNWSDVISAGGAYYGCGYTMLFAPLFRVLKDPVILYKIVLSVNTLLLSLVVFAAYYILKRGLGIKNENLSCTLSLVSSYMTVRTGSLILNEPMLIFCIWIFAVLLVKLEGESSVSKKRRVTAILMLLLSYMLSLHLRTQIMWVALVILVLFYFWKYKKWLISLPVAIISGGVGYVCVNIFIKYVQNHIWLSESGSTLTNGSTSISGKAIERILSLEGWPAWLNIVLGQLNTITIYSAGIALIFLIVAVVAGYNLIVKKIKNNENVNEKNASKAIVLGIFFLLCILITVAANSIMWLGNTVVAMEQGYGNNEAGLKSITYLRYFGCYIGPFFLTVFVYIYYKKEVLSKYLWKVILIIAVVIQGYWIACIVPYIYQNDSCKQTFLIYMLGQWDTPSRAIIYIIGSLICIILLAVNLYYLYKRKYQLFLTVSVVFLLMQSLYTIHTYKDRSNESYILADSGTKVIREIDEEHQIENIYVSGNSKMKFVYQFLLYDYNLKVGIPEENQDQLIVFTDYMQDDLFEEGYLCVELDDNEFMFVKGRDLQNKVKTGGYELKDKYGIKHRILFSAVLGENTVMDEETGEITAEGLGSEKSTFLFQNINIDRGTTKFTMQLNGGGEQREKLGFIEVYNTKTEQVESIQEIQMEKNEENTVNFEVECVAKSNYEIRVFVETGETLSVQDFYYTKVSEEFGVQSKVPGELEKDVQIISALSQNENVVFVDKEEQVIQNASLEYLQSLLPESRVEKQIYEESGEVQGTFLLTLNEDIDLIFELISKNYTIINKTGTYSLFLRTDSDMVENVENVGGVVLSEDKKLNDNYFKIGKNGVWKGDVTANLDMGRYRISSIVSGVENGGYLKVASGNRNLEATYEEVGENYQAEIEIDNYNISDRYQISEKLITNSSQNDRVTTFIEKISEIVEIDLENLENDWMTYDGSELVVQAYDESVEVETPQYTIPAGHYQVKIIYESSNEMNNFVFIGNGTETSIDLSEDQYSIELSSEENIRYNFWMQIKPNETLRIKSINIEKIGSEVGNE